MTDLSTFTADLIKSFEFFKPETTLTATIILTIIFDLIFKKSKHISGYVAIIGIVIAGIFLYQQTGVEYKAFANLLVIDDFGVFMKYIILLSSLIIIIFTFYSKELHPGKPRLG